MFKEELTPVLHDVFQETEEKGTLPNSFCEVSMTLIPKQDKARVSALPPTHNIGLETWQKYKTKVYR